MGSSMVFLLCTGVSVNLIAQHLTDLRFSDQQAHILPTVKFISSFLFASLYALHKPQSTAQPITNRQRRLMTLIGLLDAIAYVCFCIGFAACGATLSSLVLAACGQIFTALATRCILKKRLTARQVAAIGLVCLGLIIRYLPLKNISYNIPFPNVLRAPSTPSNTTPYHTTDIQFGTQQQIGYIYIVTASALYSLLGIAYESLSADKASPPPPYPVILWNISCVGLILALAYQLLYVVPRWDALIMKPFLKSGVTFSSLSITFAIFGAAFNLHMFAQSVVFRRQGALGVALVNAVRGAAVAVIVGLVFCSVEQPHLCLTMQSGVAAAVVTLGGALWVFAGQINKERGGVDYMKKDA